MIFPLWGCRALWGRSFPPVFPLPVGEGARQEAEIHLKRLTLVGSCEGSGGRRFRHMQMIRLVVVDVDGVLSHGEAAPLDFAVLQRLAEFNDRARQIRHTRR